MSFRPTKTEIGKYINIFNINKDIISFLFFSPPTSLLIFGNLPKTTPHGGGQVIERTGKSVTG